MPRTTLNERERDFAQSYVLSGNATQAARAVGYRHPRVAGPRLLKRAHVLRFLDELRQQVLRRAVEEAATDIAQVKERALTEIDPSLMDLAQSAKDPRVRLAAIELAYRRLGLFQLGQGTALQSMLRAAAGGDLPISADGLRAWLEAAQAASKATERQHDGNN